MTVNGSDSIIYVALALSALAAFLTAPADSAATYQKLHWLLTQDAAAETIPTSGAIGGPTTFPVSP